MNYNAVYERILERADNRTLPRGTYVERHHKVPRCMGGSDDESNIAVLTAEEHFLCHRMLCKIYPEHPKLFYALVCMSWNGIGNRNNKMFARDRKKHSELASDAQRVRWLDPEYRSRVSASISKSMSIRMQDDNVRTKTSMGVKRFFDDNPEAKVQLSETIKRLHVRGVYEFAYEKSSLTQKGTPKPDGFGLKVSAFQKGRVKSKEECARISLGREGKCLGDDNPMSSDVNRQKVSQSKIGRKRVHLSEGGFIYARASELQNYIQHEDGKYYDYSE